MNLRLDFLTDVTLSNVTATFCAAFADYHLPVVNLAEERLSSRLAKNAYSPECSVGAFAGDELVAISLTGIDVWQGEASAFDAATGIMPAFRGQGLARQMFAFALPRLRERGIVRFLLEVLQVNEPAIKAYSRAGFQVTREFDCYELPLPTLASFRLGGQQPATKNLGEFRIVDIDRQQIFELADELDWQPSWENSFAAIQRIPADVYAHGALVAGKLIGTVVYCPLQNWILNLVVAQEHRRQGIGSHLMCHLLAHLPAVTESVKLVNIQHSDAGMQSLLTSLGFQLYVSQFEMEVALNA
jgi:ribosomal protein S18 acetylase RimI-like enzyme